MALSDATRDNFWDSATIDPRAAVTGQRCAVVAHEISRRADSARGWLLIARDRGRRRRLVAQRANDCADPERDPTRDTDQDGEEADERPEYLAV